MAAVTQEAPSAERSTETDGGWAGRPSASPAKRRRTSRRGDATPRSTATHSSSAAAPRASDRHTVVALTSTRRRAVFPPDDTATGRRQPAEQLRKSGGPPAAAAVGVAGSRPSAEGEYSGGGVEASQVSQPAVTPRRAAVCSHHELRFGRGRGETSTAAPFSARTSVARGASATCAVHSTFPSHAAAPTIARTRSASAAGGGAPAVELVAIGTEIVARRRGVAVWHSMSSAGPIVSIASPNRASSAPNERIASTDAALSANSPAVRHECVAAAAPAHPSAGAQPFHVGGGGGDGGGDEGGGGGGGGGGGLGGGLGGGGGAATI